MFAMTKIRITITVVLFAMSAIRPYAQTSPSDNYRSEIDKMLTATDLKPHMVQTIMTIWTEMGLPLTDCEAAATEVVEAVWIDLINIYAEEYEKYYSIEDMMAINQFYETPSGKKFAKHSTEIRTAVQDKVYNNFPERIMEILQKYIRQ